MKSFIALLVVFIVSLSCFVSVSAAPSSLMKQLASNRHSPVAQNAVTVLPADLQKHVATYKAAAQPQDQYAVVTFFQDSNCALNLTAIDETIPGPFSPECIGIIPFLLYGVVDCKADESDFRFSLATDSACNQEEVAFHVPNKKPGYCGPASVVAQGESMNVYAKVRCYF